MSTRIVECQGASGYTAPVTLQLGVPGTDAINTTIVMTENTIFKGVYTGLAVDVASAVYSANLVDGNGAIVVYGTLRHSNAVGGVERVGIHMADFASGITGGGSGPATRVVECQGITGLAGPVTLQCALPGSDAIVMSISMAEYAVFKGVYWGSAVNLASGVYNTNLVDGAGTIVGYGVLRHNNTPGGVERVGMHSAEVSGGGITLGEQAEQRLRTADEESSMRSR